MAQTLEPVVPAAWSPQTGLPALKITAVRAICTAPENIRLAVVSAIQDYLEPFLIGRDPDDIEDIYQTAYVSSYWRSGPVLNNALSGVDQALWDIKGKRAGMPVYQLMGGKCRLAAPLYAHASGRDFAEVEENARKFMERGYRHVRCQVAVPG